MPDLLLGHRLLIFYLLDYNEAEVLEGMVLGSEVLVNFYRVCSFDVVPVFIYAPVGLLALQLANILLVLATVAPGEVNCVLRFAACFLANVKFLFTSSISEDFGVHDMRTAHGIRSAPARGAPSAGSFCSLRSDDLPIGQPCLSDDVP